MRGALTIGLGSVLLGACLSGTFQQRRDAWLTNARAEIVHTGACTRRQAWTCANAPSRQILSLSQDHGWSSSFFEDGRLIGEAWGSCTFRESRGRIVADCDLPDGGGEDLCELALRDVVMIGANLNTSPDGGWVSRPRMCTRPSLTDGSCPPE